MEHKAGSGVESTCECELHRTRIYSLIQRSTIKTSRGASQGLKQEESGREVLPRKVI